jgi:hypothetical protein
VTADNWSPDFGKGPSGVRRPRKQQRIAGPAVVGRAERAIAVRVEVAPELRCYRKHSTAQVLSSSLAVYRVRPLGVAASAIRYRPTWIERPGTRVPMSTSRTFWPFDCRPQNEWCAKLSVLVGAERLLWAAFPRGDGSTCVRVIR